MKFLRRGVLCCRLRFLSKLVHNRLRRHFSKWAIKVRSSCPLGLPTLSTESTQTLAVLKMVALARKGEQEALGGQSVAKLPAAFLEWKRQAQIPLDFAYDSQYRIQGLLRLGQVLDKHLRAGLLLAFTQIGLLTKSKRQRERDRMRIKRATTQMKVKNVNYEQILDH